MQKVGVAISVLLISNVAAAAGFEKTVPWSGRWAGVAGAAVSGVEGAQAIAFNPAGLAVPELMGPDSAAPRKGLELSLNFSPTFSQFSGPIITPQPIDSEWSFSPIFGGAASWHLENPKLGVGIGAFYAGGNNSVYEDVAVPGFTLRPDFRAELSIVDASVGAAWEFLPGVRAGAAWRASIVSGHLSTAASVPIPGSTTGALAAVDLKDLSDEAYEGFRAGVQYVAPDGLFGLGVDFRSEVEFEAEGTLSAQLEAPPQPPGTAPGGDVTVSGKLPWRIGAGGFVALLDRKLRVYAEYDLVRYSDVDRLDIEGSFTTPLGAVPVPDLPLDFDDQHNVRGGVEYFLQNVVVRAGYAFTSQVTPDERARATLSSPGTGHSITLGAGTRMMSDRLQLNFAADYSFANGDGTNERGIPGDFASDALVAHLGATYLF